MKTDDRNSYLIPKIKENNKKKREEDDSTNKEIETANKGKDLKQNINNINNDTKKEETDELIKNKTFLFFTICAATMFMIFFIPYKIIYQYGIYMIIGSIILYYINIIREDYCTNKLKDEKNKNLESIKSIFFNFLGVVTLYNIFLAFNPMGMVELEHSFISNILYFYISFFIISLEFNFYNKIEYLIDVLFGSILLITEKTIVVLIGLYMFSFIIGSFFVNFMTDSDSHFFLAKIISLIMTVFMILTLYMLYPSEKHQERLKNKNKKNHSWFKSFISTFENLMNSFTNWFLELFKIEKIKELKLLDKNGKMNFFNILIFIIVKIMILYILTTMYMNNKYYIQYSFTNNGYCKNLGENTIIKMKNNNVLILGSENEKSEDEYLREIRCDKEMANIKLINKKFDHIESIEFQNPFKNYNK